MPAFPENLQCLEFLGAGGQGEVWLAKDKMLARNVVCKRLDRQFAQGGDWRSTLEALSCAASRTSAIPQLFGVQTVADSCWLIQEYVEGTTLEQVYRRRPTRFSDRAILLLTMDLLGAVVAFAAAGIVHGDLNPANVLIDSAGRARIIDFNCAAVVGGNAPAAGVPGFCRPHSGSPRKAQAQDDAFGLGCLLFWLLGLPLPSAVQDLDGHLLVSPPPCPNSPSRLENLLWRMASGLTSGGTGGTGSIQEQLARLRQEARLLPGDARDELLQRVGPTPEKHAPNTPDHHYGLGSAVAPEILRAPAAQHRVSPFLAPGGVGGWSYRQLLVMLVVSGGLAVFATLQPWKSSPPIILMAPAQIAANTALPPGLNPEWLGNAVRRALSGDHARAFATGGPLLLTLRCDHRTCSLVLDRVSEPEAQRYEHSFAASRDYAVWEQAVSDLGRLVATP